MPSKQIRSGNTVWQTVDKTSRKSSRKPRRRTILDRSRSKPTTAVAVDVEPHRKFSRLAAEIALEDPLAEQRRKRQELRIEKGKAGYSPRRSSSAKQVTLRVTPVTKNTATMADDSDDETVMDAPSKDNYDKMVQELNDLKAKVNKDRSDMSLQKEEIEALKASNERKRTRLQQKDTQNKEKDTQNKDLQSRINSLQLALATAGTGSAVEQKRVKDIQDNVEDYTKMVIWRKKKFFNIKKPQGLTAMAIECWAYIQKVMPNLADEDPELNQDSFIYIYSDVINKGIGGRRTYSQSQGKKAAKCTTEFSMWHKNIFTILHKILLNFLFSLLDNPWNSSYPGGNRECLERN